MRRILLTVLCFAFAASPALAKEWTVDYGQSRIGFTGTQGSDSFEGGFKKFQLTVNFDPVAPQAGKIAATIDMASAFAGSAERDGALPQSDWFDTSKFPQAQFTSTAITADACNVKTPASAKLLGCYKAAGTLTIKGAAKPVTLEFYLVQEGDHAHAQGKVTLMRNDFGVGKGQWADPSFVKNEVTVTLDIVAR